MRVIDKGHSYELAVLDGWAGQHSLLIFVKREGAKFPGNVGHYPGTTMQECLRALIDRASYVNGQIRSLWTILGIISMRFTIWCFEQRAARRHGRNLRNLRWDIENEPTCANCGHIQCNQTCEPKAMSHQESYGHS